MQLLIRTKLVGIFLMGLTAYADDVPIEVQSINGPPVMVAPSEIKKAYIVISQRKSKNADRIVTNEDGSVAINRPYFEYNGKLLRIDASYTDPQGVCKRFGFVSQAGMEYQTIEADTTVVQLNSEGKLRDLIPPSEGSHRTVLETVACQ